MRPTTDHHYHARGLPGGSLAPALLVLLLPASGLRGGVFRQAARGRIVAESARFRAEFRNGRLMSLRSGSSGRELLAPAGATYAPIRALPAKSEEPYAGADAAISPDGRSVTFTAAARAGTRRWTVEFAPDECGVIISGEVTNHDPGLEAVELVLPGPDWNRLQLALPVGAQGLTLRSPQPGVVRTFRYCAHRQWEAQVAVFEPRTDAPPGSGRRTAAGFVVWAEDRDFMLKRFTVDRGGGNNLLRLVTETEGDPARVRRGNTVRWHVEVFRGDWRVPAARYRAWMTGAFCPPGWQPPAWTRDIGMFVKIGRALDPTLLPALARRIDPRRTLLVLPDWRRNGYDQNYPDYTPAPGFEAFCREAHRLGFRVMVHFSTFGCSPYNPAFERLKPYILEDRAGRRQGWRLDQKQNRQRHYEIHPGAAAFRKILVDNARALRRRFGVDAFHLDVSLKLVNPKSGRVEGLDVGQGKQRLFEELVRAVPDAAFGGEELNESAFAIFSFAQRTPFDDPQRRGHPIGSFLFGDRVKYYSHYSRTPDAEDSNTRTGDFLRVWAPAGICPTFAVSLPAQLDGPCARILSRVGQVFQKYRLVPAPAVAWPWPDRVCFFWREQTPAQRIWRTTITGREARLACDAETAWREQTGLSAAGPGWSIPGWPAGDDRGSSGLDPVQPYVLIPGKPYDRVPRFLRIAPDLTLNHWQLSRRVIRAEFVPNRRQTAVAVLSEWRGEVRTGILVNRSQEKSGREMPIGCGAVWERRPVLSGTVRLPGFAAHPPWKQVPGGRKDAAVFAEFRVPLPADTRSGGGLVLDWFGGMLNPGRGSDGVTYEVEIDGRRVFRKHIARKGWQALQCPLTAFMGRTVSIRLLTTPGPAGDTTWDLCGWGDPIVRTAPVTGEVRIRPLRPALHVTDQNGRSVSFRHTPDGDVSLSVSAPSWITLRCDRGDRVPRLPCDLFSIPHTAGRYGTGGGWRPVPPGAEIGKRREMSCGGARYPDAVFAHPPQYGRTVLQWLVRLPDTPTLHLALGYGIAGSLSRGVSFRVRVNGREIRRDDMTRCGHRTALVPLAEFAGTDVLLELVTDSMGPADFDWAFWSRMELTTARTPPRKRPGRPELRPE